MENWRIIKTLEVSDHGNVRIAETKEPCKISFDSSGYPVISRHTDGKSFIRIHRLVAQAFLESDENKKSVNHKDGNKANNHVSNLEWCTHQYNMLHARRILKKSVEENHHWTKLKVHEVKEIYKLKHVYGLSHRLIASLFGISHSHVSNITRQKNCWHGIDFELSI